MSMTHEHYQNEGKFEHNRMYYITCNLQIFVNMLKEKKKKKDRAIPVRQISINT